MVAKAQKRTASRTISNYADGVMSLFDVTCFAGPAPIPKIDGPVGFRIPNVQLTIYRERVNAIVTYEPK